MRDSRVEVVETGQPPVQLLACALCGVLLWDIRAHYRHAHLGAAPQAESEPKPHTRVVTRSFDSDCALGICMSGCSHLMWVCDSCSSEGGWGAARGQLKKWAAEHVCPVLPSSGVERDPLCSDDRKMLASVFQQYCELPEGGLSDDFYEAVIAVANVGYERGIEHLPSSGVDETREGK